MTRLLLGQVYTAYIQPCFAAKKARRLLCWNVILRLLEEQHLSIRQVNEWYPVFPNGIIEKRSDPGSHQA